MSAHHEVLIVGAGLAGLCCARRLTAAGVGCLVLEASDGVGVRDVRVRQGLYVCGGHRDNASINGAMESGRRAADAVLADRGHA